MTTDSDLVESYKFINNLLRLESQKLTRLVKMFVFHFIIHLIFSVTSFTHLFSMTCLKVNESDPNDMYAGTGHVSQQFFIFDMDRYGKNSRFWSAIFVTFLNYFSLLCPSNCEYLLLRPRSALEAV